MTKDELIEMAKDAGFRVFGDKIVAADNGISGDASQSIERFAALVAAKEREECAKVCEGFSAAEYATGKVDHNEMAWTDRCAMSIRGRKP